MKRTILLSTVLTTLVTGMPVQARDMKYMVPLEAALAAPEVKERIVPAVKLYFGKQPHPEVAATIGTPDVSGKARIDSANDMTACQKALAEALAQLQTNAISGGADAVINIVSYYKRGEPTASDTAIECHAGSKSVGLSLRGDLVKFAK